MRAARPLLQAALGTLALGLAFLLVGIARPDDGWFTAHGTVLVFGTALGGLAYFHVLSVSRFGGGDLHPVRVQVLAGLLTAGAVLLASGHLVPHVAVQVALRLLGGLLLLLAALVQAQGILGALPRESVVDVDHDPLTKGDDACFKHLRLAHVFLPLGLAMLVGPLAFGAGHGPSARLMLAGTHVLLIGHGVLSIYGLGHLWIPRFSGVPAIAAGAIKGELHTTLLGLVGITVGFLVGIGTGLGRGLVAGLGPFVFLGFFVYMGVLGANIMRNKSRTQRVTPEFNYIPWTFSGVFWLISAVLLGVFLNAVPDLLAPVLPGLRFVHVHMALLGGLLQLLIGWLHRLLPMLHGAPPAPFAASKWAFYGFNTGIVLLIWGRLRAAADGLPFSDDGVFLAGTALTLLALGLLVPALRPARTTPEATP